MKAPTWAEELREAALLVAEHAECVANGRAHVASAYRTAAHLDTLAGQITRVLHTSAMLMNCRTMGVKPGQTASGLTRQEWEVLHDSVIRALAAGPEPT